METIDGLIEFNYVAENNGFSAAARVMKVSKSHISKQVTKLEAQLQVSLLNRTTRKITLTDAGKQLYEKSSHLLNQLDDVFTEITQTQKEPVGAIKISVAGAFAEEYLANIFSSFLKINTKVKIEIYFSERFVDLIDEDFDLAIRYGNLNDSSLISKKIASRREFICASPEYIKSNGTPKKPKDLTSHNCLIGYNDQWSFMNNRKKQTIKVTGSWKSNNGRAIATAVKKDLGIAKLPGVYVFDAIQKGELISLLDEYTQKEQDIWVLYPQKKHVPFKVRSLIDYLSEYLEEHHSGILF
jgi:DNA-binding transcriptional LysR family regulator